MGEITERKSVDLQIAEKKQEISKMLNETILSQYAYTAESNTPESFKKKQEVAMFVSKLVGTTDTAGRPAILSCTAESIRECCITYCNNELNFFRNQAYLIPYGNKLTFMIGKDGYVATAKELNPNIEDFYSEVVYKKDIFEYNKVAGKTVITKHIQKLENITCKIEDIVCAYATCVYKDGSHIADIMTMDEILNALKTAHKPLTDTHKTNPKVMLGKFPLRRLAKTKINQSANEEVRNNIIFDDEKPLNVTPSEIKVEINEEQDFAEIKESEVVEWTEEEMLECVAEENEIIIPYHEWTNKYKATGEWEQVRGSYNTTDKTIKIKRKC